MSEDNLSTGWISVYRSIQNKGWFKDSEYVHLWVYLLMLAAHKTNEWLYKGKVMKVLPGQLITSRNSLSVNTGISESKIERILKCFEIEQQIEQQNLYTSRLISILNYNKYQNSEQQNEQQVNSKRTASEQQVNTNNNVNNDNNVNKIPTLEEIFNYFKDVTNDGVFAHLYGSDFFDWYENTNWTYKKRGKDVTPIKNWKLKAREWIRRDYPKFEQQQKQIEIPKEPVYSIPNSYDTYNDPANPWNQ